jgi:hypothetical protein
MNDMAYDLPFVILPHVDVIINENPVADDRQECTGESEGRIYDKEG